MFSVFARGNWEKIRVLLIRSHASDSLLYHWACMAIKPYSFNNYSFIKSSIVTLPRAFYLGPNLKIKLLLQKRALYYVSAPWVYGKYCSGTVHYWCYINLHQVIFHSASNYARKFYTRKWNWDELNWYKQPFLW